MVQTSWREKLTQEEQDLLFMLTVEDDTEEAPWMVMGDLQFWSATGFAHSLQIYGQAQGLAWYVAGMLPIEYHYPGVPRKKKVAPDVLVSFVPQKARSSYDVDAEGMFPPFVLEVVSPSSTTRDRVEKVTIYRLLGAQEYALFTPETGVLEGYRRGAGGELEPWPREAGGRLFSAVLGLFLVGRRGVLQAMTPQGRLLLTPEEEAAAREQAEAAREQAEAAREQAEAAREVEAQARQVAETELAQLRAELERLRGNDS